MDANNNLLEDVVCIRGTLIDLIVLRTDRKSVLIYTNWLNDEEIRKYTGYNNRVINFDQVNQWVNQAHDLEDCLWSIVDTKSRRLVGTCSCRLKRGTKNAIVDICIGEVPDRNRGYGSEAITLMVKFAFEDMNAHRVEVKINSENKVALQCFKAAGFIECGRSHESDYFDGFYSDTITMEILKKDWLSRRLVTKQNKNSKKKENKIRDISKEEEEILLNEDVSSYIEPTIYTGYVVVCEDNVIPPVISNEKVTFMDIHEFMEASNTKDAFSVTKGVYIKADLLAEYNLNTYLKMISLITSPITLYTFNELPKLNFELNTEIVVYPLDINDNTEILASENFNVLVISSDSFIRESDIDLSKLNDDRIPEDANIIIRQPNRLAGLKNIDLVVYYDKDNMYIADRLIFYNKSYKSSLDKDVIDVKSLIDSFNIAEDISNKSIYAEKMNTLLAKNGLTNIKDYDKNLLKDHKNIIIIFNDYDKFIKSKDIDQKELSIIKDAKENLDRIGKNVNITIL